LSSRPGLRTFLELLGLSGLAVAQPLLAVFGDAPDYFVFKGSSTRDIVAFAFAVVLVPPIALWALAQVVGWRDHRRRRLAQEAAVGLLIGLLVLQVAVGVGLALGPAVASAVAAGAGAGWSHGRWPGIRLWAAWLAPAPFVFLGAFLFASPVSGLVRGGDVDPADLGAFASGDPPPVVMMVFDEWPLASIVRSDGSIDADLYPNLAELAGDSTWYRDTTTVANLTNFAVPAMLTGDMPGPGDTADTTTHPENLFTLLGGTYDLDVTERITRLCPASLCDQPGNAGNRGPVATVTDLLAEAGQVFVDRLGPGEQSGLETDVFVEPAAAVDRARNGPEEPRFEDLDDPRPESVDRFLAGFQPDEDPTVHFLHLLEPHTPYLDLPDGRRYGSDPSLRLISPREDGEPGGDRRAAAVPPARLDRQRLQLEIAHVDRLLGDVLDRLRQTGLYDDALVVVTSDHGIAFRPGGPVRGLGIEPIDEAAQPELLWVPLFVKSPGQTEGEVSDVPATTMDVLPTIAERLGIQLPWDVDGEALTPAVAPDRERRFVHVAGSSFATFELDAPVTLDADIEDVLALGVDSVLPGTGPDRWWRFGPEPDRVGGRATESRLDAAIDGLAAFLDVDLSDPVVPAVVAGRVDGAVARVAVAVNGTIAAVVDTYDDGDGPGRFAAIVDPGLLVDGVNSVTVHRVD
jgi:hypothetical protein